MAQTSTNGASLPQGAAVGERASATDHAPGRADGIQSLLSQLPPQAQQQLAGMNKERLKQIVAVRDTTCAA